LTGGRRAAYTSFSVTLLSVQRNHTEVRHHLRYLQLDINIDFSPVDWHDISVTTVTDLALGVVCIKATRKQLVADMQPRTLRISTDHHNDEMPSLDKRKPAFHVRAGRRRLVALYITAVFLSAEGQQISKLVAIKADNGSVLCAISAPDSRTPARSKLECSKDCLSSGCLCASGANYRMRDKRCEMYSDPPTDYRVEPDCTFYRVGIPFEFDIIRVVIAVKM